MEDGGPEPEEPEEHERQVGGQTAAAMEVAEAAAEEQDEDMALVAWPDDGGSTVSGIGSTGI